MADTSAEHRADIDGLRAIAVVAVILFHFGVPWFSGGFTGVDVFFVISGFLMASIIVGKLQSGRFSVWDFYLARARRIFPALAALCGALLVFGWLSLDPIQYRRLALHAASSLTFLSNFTYWQEAGYFDVASHEKWLLHTWSLSVEWQFYLLFPILLLVTWKLFRSRRALGIAVAAAFLLSLTLSIYVTPRRLDTAYYLLPTRAWELLAGSLVFLVSSNVTPSRAVARSLEIVGIALILAAAMMMGPLDPWPGYLALIPVAGAALVIVARNTGSVITANPVARFIGLSSYSIYLWHWPVLVALRFQRLEHDRRWAIGAIFLSILLGYLSYRLVEVPTRRKGMWRSRPAEVLAMASVAAALVGSGLLAYQMHGFPGRLGTDAAPFNAAAAAIDDWGHPGRICRKVQPGADLCDSPGEGGPLVMFIGDSIAQEFYPRYGELRHDRRDSTLFVTRSGCPPIRNIDGYPPGKHCGQYADFAWKEVRERTPQELFVVANWWTNFFDDSDHLFGATCITGPSGCSPVRDRDTLQRAFASLESDVREAVSRGVHVYIIGPMPISRIDYPQVRLAELAARHLPLPIERPLDFNQSNRWFSFDQGPDSPPQVLLQLLAAVAQHSGAELVMPQQYLCPRHHCPFADGSGTPIYKDSVHLRKAYVQSGALMWLDRIVGING